MLNLWRFSLLRDLSNLGTMAAVAQAANLSRPAVSQHLAQLEKESGLLLFERTSRGVRLTDEGMRLAQHAHELLAHVASIESDMATFREEIVGTVRFAAFGSFATAVASKAVAALRAEHPGLQPVFLEQEPQNALTALLRRGIDLAVVDDMVSLQSEGQALEFLELMDDQFLAALPAGHRLSSKVSLTMHDLRAERWVVNESAAAYHHFVLHACRDAGFTPNVVCSSRSGATALSFVANSGMVSVLPQLSSIDPPRGVVFKTFEPKLGRRIQIAVNRGRSLRPSVKAVIEGLRAAVAEGPQ